MISEEIKISQVVTVNSVNHDRAGSVSIKFNESTTRYFFGNVFSKELLLH